jgi:hypothetical protein
VSMQTGTVDWEQFERLGKAVAQAWKARDYDEERFPELAQATLEAFDFDRTFDLGEAIRWILARSESPGTPQFADCHLTVFRTDRFVVDLNIWVHSGIVIHSHAFAGAFQIFAGSSFHAPFVFTPQRRLGSQLLLGAAEPQALEYLVPGDTVAIRPGLGGLNHALVHRERPSATVVVRTDFLPWHEPQYELLPPFIACAPHPASNRNRLMQAHQGLRALFSTSPEAFAQAMIDDVSRIDAPSLVQLFAACTHEIHGSGCLEALIQAAVAHHPELDGLLAPVHRQRHRLQLLERARAKVVLDRELNTLSALLQWGRSREEICGFVGRLDPSERAEATVVTRLAQLFEKSALSLRLPEHARRQLLEAALWGEDEGQMLQRAHAEYDMQPDADEKLRTIYRRLLGMPELAVLLARA